ncbi:hypothetical protein CTAYLR_008970 [Chrysophaeum taylorii]|uniref:Fatty acid hydroxylase domain-containing protein n=1 Tax=Chrysophaeum taylorii TaxID=2483200 RepID=A0AAD7UL01_9STRA|nr:hypothetical protein CTAYLR_008970 [Chrysophaeum taylorii]
MCRAPPRQGAPGVASWACAAWLWVLIVSWPLALRTRYERVFPAEWYAETEPGERPRALGLLLGLFAVAWGHVFVVAYQYARWRGSRVFGPLVKVQPNEERTYEFSEGVATHLFQPEGFVVLGLYLSATWLCGWMPRSYYRFDGGIEWAKVAMCLLVQDALQFAMHRLEHSVSPSFYKSSHKPHHRFTNPRTFDAFNGSLADTLLMILVPLFATAWIVRCNVWSYMTFGTLYANWLVLIHSEYHHLWDPVFLMLKFGTAADHHVHHKLFIKNYGHLFMYWDLMCGTYKDPRGVRVFHPKNVL